MTIEGHVEHGHVVFDTPVVLPDGTKVRVSVQPASNLAVAGEELPSLYERLKPAVGKAKGLPTDFAMSQMAEDSTPILEPEAWIREFDAWVGDQTSHNPHFDDSRESIYPDRT